MASSRDMIMDTKNIEKLIQLIETTKENLDVHIKKIHMKVKELGRNQMPL